MPFYLLTWGFGIRGMHFQCLFSSEIDRREYSDSYAYFWVNYHITRAGKSCESWKKCAGLWTNVLNCIDDSFFGDFCTLNVQNKLFWPISWIFLLSNQSLFFGGDPLVRNPVIQYLVQWNMEVFLIISNTIRHQNHIYKIGRNIRFVWREITDATWLRSEKISTGPALKERCSRGEEQKIAPEDNNLGVCLVHIDNLYEKMSKLVYSGICSQKLAFNRQCVELVALKICAVHIADFE